MPACAVFWWRQFSSGTASTRIFDFELFQMHSICVKAPRPARPCDGLAFLASVSLNLARPTLLKSLAPAVALGIARLRRASRSARI
jgi:hypothetical protein